MHLKEIRRHWSGGWENRRLLTVLSINIEASLGPHCSSVNGFKPHRGWQTSSSRLHTGIWAELSITEPNPPALSPFPRSCGYTECQFPLRPSQSRLTYSFPSESMEDTECAVHIGFTDLAHENYLPGKLMVEKINTFWKNQVQALRS